MHEHMLEEETVGLGLVRKHFKFAEMDLVTKQIGATMTPLDLAWFFRPMPREAKVAILGAMGFSEEEQLETYLATTVKVRKTLGFGLSWLWRCPHNTHTFACSSSQNDAPSPVAGVAGAKPCSCPSVNCSPPGPIQSTRPVLVLGGCRRTVGGADRPVRLIDGSVNR